MVNRNECYCGSGKVMEPCYDARMIFLCYTCDDCHESKMAKYRPDVLTDSNYWHDEPIGDDSDLETFDDKGFSDVDC